MACIDATVGELERDGWLVNQTRMWLASHWAVREGARWQDGEDRFFAHLLDGSRAANRLGWQWTTGVGSSKPYGFSRSQVEKRAPELCAGCERRDACPIADWPDDPPYSSWPEPTAGTGAHLHGPLEAVVDGEADVVWLTAESLGDDDPALAAHPDLPVVFVFDEPLLARLRLDAKRLVFLTETLAELGTTRHRRAPRRLADRHPRRQAPRGHPCAGARLRPAGRLPHRRRPASHGRGWRCPPAGRCRASAPGGDDRAH